MSPSAASSSKGPARLPDPLCAFRFRIEIDGRGPVRKLTLGCNECSGLSSESETHEYREGGVNDYVHVLRGPMKSPPIVLKRGFAVSSDLLRWYTLIMQGRTSRSSGSIVLIDPAASDKALMVWSFKDAFPTKWTGPELKADSASIAFESIELAHRGLTWDTV